jgi:hypothetical protein
MPKYDFKTLSPIDFEILTRDLLQEELGIRLENFKSGRDDGIDLRYSSNGKNSVIVQCKHYAESSFRLLCREFAKDEVDKIGKLKPGRYILATSLGLTPRNKAKIRELCAPFIKSPSDIFGREDLNGLLAKFPKIERYTFKLWLTSLTILEEVLHSKIKNVSRDAIDRIMQHTRYYVQNASFGEAIKILEKYNYCIIAGIPGIGKTILAEMLTLHYVNQGYGIAYITGDISEAMALDYVNQKRIFYYDDFLGQTALSEKLNKNEDQRLIQFIRTISSSKTSKLILTTREYILHQAQLIYEKLSREKFVAETCILDLKKYNRINRAQILYNHIYFSDLPAHFKKVIFRDRSYLKIIDHPNYNPRIIDLMTQYSRIQQIKPTEYLSYFIGNLDNPLEIWRHAFEEQLSISARNLLIAMASMPEHVFLEDIQEAFLAFHLKQASIYKFSTSPNDFVHALKEAEGNFITIEKSRDRRIVRYHNPSIRDYLREYISSNEQVLRFLILSARFYDQYMILWEVRKELEELSKYHRVFFKFQSEFLHALAASIHSRSCRLINYRGASGELYQHEWPISYEAKATLIISVALEFRDELTFKFLRKVLENIKLRIVAKQANRDDLIRFMKEYNKSVKIIGEIGATFISTASTYFTTSAESLHDIEAFWEFNELFPGIVDTESLARIKHKFVDIAEEDSTYIPEDPDVYRDDAYKIEKLAKRFRIDMEKRVEELKDRAEELESEQMRIDAENYEESGYDRGRNEVYSDNEIASIFDTMKN